MKDFEPYLHPEKLEGLDRAEQLHPLDKPYRWKSGRPVKKSASVLSQIQVKARPDDPNSPFVWGKYALMLVCGGYYTKAQEKKHATGPQQKLHQIDEKHADGEQTHIDPPSIHHSSASTTGTLFTGMIRAGFTWQEATECLLRHWKGGGAHYWWSTQHGNSQRTEAEYAKWRSERKFIVTDLDGVVLEEMTDPFSIPEDQKKFNPWTAWHPQKGQRSLICSIDDLPRDRSSMEHITLPTHVHTETGDTMGIQKDRAREILQAISLHTMERPSAVRSKLVAGDVRVTSANAIKRDPAVKMQGNASGWIRGLYLPYLISWGLVEEYPKTALSKDGPQKGQLPHYAYAVTSKYRDREIMAAFWAQWQGPDSLFTALKIVKPQTADDEQPLAS